MKQRLSMDEIMTAKQRGKCPKCGAELQQFTFEEDGDIIEARKCAKGCGWWGR